MGLPTNGQRGVWSVGMDLTGTVSYFGSLQRQRTDRHRPGRQSRRTDRRKEILWESETATDAEIPRNTLSLYGDKFTQKSEGNKMDERNEYDHRYL